MRFDKETGWQETRSFSEWLGDSSLFLSVVAVVLFFATFAFLPVFV